MPAGVPEGFHTVTPYLIFKEPVKAIEFYQKAFGAVETYRLMRDDGRLRHAQIRVGNSMLMLTCEGPDWNMFGPEHYGGSPAHLFLYVEDADTMFGQAVAAGAKPAMEMSDQEYGRSGGVVDPFGLTWWITTHRE